MATKRTKTRGNASRRSRGTARAEAPDPRELARLVRRVEWWKRRLSPRLPDIPPEDLDLILSSLLRPRTWPRTFLLREIRPGVFVF